jgi:hypothetical protein
MRGNPAPATRKSLLIEKLEGFFHWAKNESEVFREWPHEKRQTTRHEWRLFLVKPSLRFNDRRELILLPLQRKPSIEVQRPKRVNPAPVSLY